MTFQEAVTAAAELLTKAAATDGDQAAQFNVFIADRYITLATVLSNHEIDSAQA